MARLLDLRQQRHDLAAEARGLDLATDEGTARLSAIEAEIGALDTSILAEERRQELVRALPAQPPASQPARVTDLAAAKPWGYATYNCTAEEFAQRYASPFIAATDPRHPTQQYQNAADGEFLKAVYRASKGFGTDPRLLDIGAAGQGANEFVGADGGFLLPRPSADRIMLRMTAGEVLSRVSRQPMTQGNSLDINVIEETTRATGSRHGAVQGYRVDEGTAPTASRPKFAQLSFKLHKYAALGYASDELLADASMVGRVIFDAFGDELRFMAEDDIINGSGTGMPLGILNANALVSVSKEPGQAAATFLYENAAKMVARFHAREFGSAVWFINQDVYPQLLTMAIVVGVGGAPVFLPPSGAAGSPLGTLFGRPIVPIEYCATLGTVGDVILADLGEYWFFDKGTPQEATSMHVAFTTDEQAFRVTYRCDGKLSWIAPLTPYKGTGNTQSCVVALATRA